MQLRNSFSPQRKCFTPSMWDSRQPLPFKKPNQRYLKTEDADGRVVQSRNEESKKKSHSIVATKKNRSMSHHKQSLNSSFNARTVRTSQNISNRKSSLQNRLQPYSTTHESTQQYFPNSPTKRILQCQKLIEAKRFQEALKELEEIDNSQLSPLHAKDVAYYKGLAFMNTNQYEQAIHQFQRTKLGEQQGQVAILQAVCYKKLGSFGEAIGVLKEFLGKKYAKTQPIYYDLLIYKGKLLMKAKKYAQAIQDFSQASTLEQEGILYQGAFGRADCLRLSGKFTEALNVYESIPQSNTILMRKILCHMEIQSFDRAMELVEEYLESDPQSSEGMYIKGQIYVLKSQTNEGILSFEQAIKQNNSRKAVTKALLEIGKIKIEQRDFYSAYYTLQRADHLDVDPDSILKLRQFTEGVIFLMKRKYLDAVNLLSNLINNYQLGDFIKKLVFQYRAYGFICINKYQKALNDLIYVSNLQELDVQSMYNRTICEGIIMAQQNQFEKAIQQFQRAAKLYPGKMEPHFYKAMTLMQFVNKHQPNDKDKHIKNALKHLDKAITLNDSNSNLLYHRGVLRFYFGLIDEALQDLNKTVEKNEEHIPKYYYARGLVRACLHNPKQALSDFSIAINWDEKYAEAYLNRAKVFSMLGDRNAAFNDLQIYIKLKPSDPEIHLWAGNLLFNITAYEHAIKTYSHSPEIQNNVQLLRYRAQCQIIMKELNSAMIDLQRIIELTGDKKCYVDKEALLALKTASMGPEDSQLQQVIKMKDQDKLVNYRLSSQMLKKLIKLNFDGYVFLVSDLYFYRGTMKFYLCNYKKAIDHWTKSYTLKQQNEESYMNNNSRSYDSLISQQDRLLNELEELEFEDRTYTMYEYYFNVAMATALNKQKAKAKDLLNQLAQSLTETYENQVREFIAAMDSPVPQCMNIFPYSNRLCCIFPTFKVGNIETRLSFCLPHIAPPSMNPDFDRKLIENLQPTVVDNKPEAPWIRRNPDGVIFTDNIQQVDLDLKSESQRSQAQQSSQPESNMHSHISLAEENINLEINNDSTTYQTNYKKDIELLKQQLRLDQAVEQRLARLK